MSEKRTNSKKFEDFISHEPQLYKMITTEQMYIARDYFWILTTLAGNPMTANDIIDHCKELGREVKLPTLYRHLDKLEEAGFIAIVGHRTKKKQRGNPKKLYHRTAKVFLLAPQEQIDGTPLEDPLKAGAERLRIVLEELFQPQDLDPAAANEKLLEVFKLLHPITGEIIEKADTNEKINEMLTKGEISSLMQFIDIATLLTMLLRHPGLYEDLSKMFIP
jgi:hypothetical protein